MLENGWTFEGPELASRTPIGDDLYQSRHYHQLYTRAKSDYTGRVTVPVLWDKAQQTIASNESAEIIRMFNSAFNGITGNTLDFYPESQRSEIDAVNERVYHTVNNGVYKSGFATSQDAYEEAFTALFDTLDWLEHRLSDQRYLVGNEVTEADWRLFTTLVRFDAVYVGHFKCNLRRIADYPNLQNYLQDLYQQPGIAETVDMVHIKRHYYFSHRNINPTGVVPKGPALSLDAAHDRGRFTD
jgi:putative glutathione S-transferase